MNEKESVDKKISSVYFIGIGGIGMSAIARFFESRGVKVSGYDKTPTTLTKELESAGIAVHYEDNVELIPKDAELVVYTPAVPKDHKELVYYQQHGYKVVKRSDVLEMITESSFNICIAGTHGKTTITTMVAHLLRDSGYGCNAFLGGISVNYGTNFWSDPGSGKNVCVIEADEYDRSFLKLSPDIAIITAMDADHLDIYGTAEAVEQGFIDFSKKVKPGGLLVSKFGLKRGNELKGDRHITYSLQHQSADVYAANIKMMNGSYEFDVMMKDNILNNVKLNMGGMHNIENAVAAIAVASSLKIENEKIKAAVESFKGVKRRFEYIIKEDHFVFIDDYAHHPEELKALITGAKGLFPDKECCIVFQPHLYSRTRDLADEFAEALALADSVFLLPIYPARELPIEGVTSQLIADKIKEKENEIGQNYGSDTAHVFEDRQELIGLLQYFVPNGRMDLLITAGAGDIDALVQPLKESLKGLY
jgi:UDP-N-acetylmuramate--alanine ligase